MKKLLLASSLMVSSSVMAQGFYVGGQAGMVSLKAKQETTTTEADFGTHGAGIGLFAGYRYDLDNFFIAAEADGFYSSAAGKLRVGSINQELKEGNSMGLSALAGIPIGGSTEVYGRLGLTKAKFEAEEITGSTKTEYDESETGTVFGVGMQHQLDDRLGVRFDYRYIQYKEFKFLENSADYKITEQVFSVGVQYSF